jgi:Ni/Fe-hydrogenase subunit HybB-like protein
VVALGIYGIVRLRTMAAAGALPLALAPGYENRMFLLEFGLGVALPVLLLAIPAVRCSRGGLVAGALLAVLGFVMNRLNVSITGLEGSAGVRYLPSWTELAVSTGLVALGFAAFILAVRTLPIFPRPPAAEPGAAHARGAGG